MVQCSTLALLGEDFRPTNRSMNRKLASSRMVKMIEI